MQDNQKILLGTGDDIEIFHDGTHSRIVDNSSNTAATIIQTDHLRINNLANTENHARFFANTQVELFFNGNRKLETNNTGGVVTGIVSATTFSGNATTATELSINGTNQLLYQAGNNNSAILPTGNSGQILQSNGSGSAPQWVTSAPAGAIEGITIRDESSIVGTANSISTINFVGSNVTADAAALAGISTIQIDHMTIQDEGSVVGTAGSISTLNFVGAGIAAAVSGSTATITAAGGVTNADVVALAIALG